MNIQTLKQARKYILRYISDRPRAKLKTIYKAIRKWSTLSLYGDWPLISEIVYCSAEKDKFYTPKELVETYRLTTDPNLKRLRKDSELVLKLTNKDELRRS